MNAFQKQTEVINLTVDSHRYPLAETGTARCMRTHCWRRDVGINDSICRVQLSTYRRRTGYLVGRGGKMCRGGLSTVCLDRLNQQPNFAVGRPTVPPRNRRPATLGDRGSVDNVFIDHPAGQLPAPALDCQNTCVLVLQCLAIVSARVGQGTFGSIAPQNPAGAGDMHLIQSMDEDVIVIHLKNTTCEHAPVRAIPDVKSTKSTN